MGTNRLARSRADNHAGSGRPGDADTDTDIAGFGMGIVFRLTKRIPYDGQNMPYGAILCQAQTDCLIKAQNIVLIDI
jgi:hypothetical protein